MIAKAIAHINNELYVSQLQYTVSVTGQKGKITGDDMRAGDSFGKVETHTETLKHASISQLKYDLVGKVAEGTILTRKTAAAILMGIAPDKFAINSLVSAKRTLCMSIDPLARILKVPSGIHFLNASGA